MTKPKKDPELPSHIHAETTILGAILIDSDHYKKLSGKLDPSDFSLESHRRIWMRMVELYDAGSAVDVVTLTDSLMRHKELDSVGGRSYLFGLSEGLPMRPALKDYLRILREKRMLREIIADCTEAIDAAYEAQASKEITQRLTTALGRLSGE